MFPKETETQRLHLRRICPDDADFVFSYASDPEVVKYVAWPSPSSIDDTKSYINEAIESWERQEWFEYLIERKSDSEKLGAVSIVPDGHSAVLGYVIAQPHWGNGYATEAAQHALDLALANPRIIRVWTVADAKHSSSYKVLEKIGMECEGLLRKWKVRPNLDEDTPRDSYCYSVVKET